LSSIEISKVARAFAPVSGSCALEGQSLVDRQYLGHLYPEWSAARLEDLERVLVDADSGSYPSNMSAVRQESIQRVKTFFSFFVSSLPRIAWMHFSRRRVQFVALPPVSALKPRDSGLPEPPGCLDANRERRLSCRLGWISSDGGCGLAVKAPDCGSGHRGFESRHPPLTHPPAPQALCVPAPWFPVAPSSRPIRRTDRRSVLQEWGTCETMVCRPKLDDYSQARHDSAVISQA
jgi:hypothetical protein